MEYLILTLLGTAGVGAVGLFTYRLVKEILPTVDQAKSAAATFQNAVSDSKEVGEHFKSITDRINQGRQQAQFISLQAGETMNQISNVSKAAKPIGEALVLLRTLTGPGRAPLQMQKRAKKYWRKLKGRFKKIRVKRNSTARSISLFGIPLLVGAGIAGYVTLLFRRRSNGTFDRPRAQQPEQLAAPPNPEVKKKRLKRNENGNR